MDVEISFDFNVQGELPLIQPSPQIYIFLIGFWELGQFVLVHFSIHWYEWRSLSVEYAKLLGKIWP